MGMYILFGALRLACTADTATSQHILCQNSSYIARTPTNLGWSTAQPTGKGHGYPHCVSESESEIWMTSVKSAVSVTADLLLGPDCMAVYRQLVAEPFMAMLLFSVIPAGDTSELHL